MRLAWPRWFPFRRRTVSQPAPTPPPAPKPQPSTPAVDAHRGASTFEPAGPMKVSLTSATGFTAAEKAKLEQARVLFEKVLNSPDFKAAVLAKTTDGKRGFANAEGKTNEQIWEAIVAAKESYTSEADGEADLTLHLKTFGFWQRNVVGYTYESTPQITMNRRFFSSYTPAEIAGNMAHEWLHKLGFEHDFNRTARRPDSVPYAVGDLVEELAEKLAA